MSILYSVLIENEEHFLLYCPFYQEERILMFVKILNIDNEILSDENQVFSRLMSCTDVDTV